MSSAKNLTLDLTYSILYRQIPTLQDYYRFTFFPRSIIHWNTLPAHIPVLPTLVQFSSSVCQVIHVSPKHQFANLQVRVSITYDRLYHWSVSKAIFLGQAAKQMVQKMACFYFYFENKYEVLSKDRKLFLMLLCCIYIQLFKLSIRYESRIEAPDKRGIEDNSKIIFLISQ